MSFSGVVLAGGASRRMGREKASLLFEGRTLLSRQVELIKQLGADEIFISGRPEYSYAVSGCQVLCDRFVGCGPLAGIERALEAARWSRVLVLAVDMPFLEQSVLWQLVTRSTDCSGVVPAISGNLEPLVAVYPKTAYQLATDCLSTNSRRARDFAKACVQSHLAEVFDIPFESHGTFANWNYPDDVPVSASGKTNRVGKRKRATSVQGDRPIRKADSAQGAIPAPAQ